MNEQSRTVQFGLGSEIPIASPLEETNVSDLWYSPKELASLRLEAYSACRRMMNDDKKREECLLAQSIDTRGLEQRVCPERRRKRNLNIKSVLLAQQDLDAHMLACLAFKCTSWASELAMLEAARDYNRAYVDNNAFLYENWSNRTFDSEYREPICSRMQCAGGFLAASE